MADQFLHTPVNPHFFQPLLPGFLTHLNIPVAFFSKHIEGSNDQNKTAKLRSDASDQTWLVKIDGLKITDGWEDFALAHDLRIGDIVIFRHEGEMVFHVTVLGPSCCEIQYTPSHIKNANSDAETNIGNSSRDKRVKKNPRKKAKSSSDHSRFVTHVSPSSLKFDRLYFPRTFAESNGLSKSSRKEIVLLNEKGRSWTLDLKHNKASMQTFVRPGWRRFCAENRIEEGDSCTFELVRKSGRPSLRLCRAEPKTESASHHSCFVGSVTPSSHHSYFVGFVTPSSLEKDKMYLPKGFVTANGLDKGCSEIVLKNERGRYWSLVLKYYESFNFTILRQGWTSFCQVNGIKVGDSFKFKLVGTGEKPVLSLCPADPKEKDEKRLANKNLSQDRLKVEKKKNLTRCRASSSHSQNQFVTLTLTWYAFDKYKLILPRRFTRVNGIDKPGKITLLGQDGVRRVVDILKNGRGGMMRLGKGWREFCEAHDVKIYESFVLELFWEEEASPVLKFCTKVNSV